MLRTGIAAVIGLLIAVQVCAVAAHGLLDRRIAAVSQQILDRPSEIRLFLRRGDLHREHRNWPAAADDYRTAEKLQPHSAAVHYHIGLLHLDRNSWQKARARFNRAIALDPKHADAYRLRARSLMQLKNYQSALRDYDLALRHDKQAGPSLHIARAKAAEAAGLQRDAYLGLLRGVKKLGPAITLVAELVELELRLGQHRQALKRLDTLPAKLQKSPRWLVRRADHLMAMGAPDKARKLYSVVLQELNALPKSRRGPNVAQLIRRAEKGAMAREK